MGLQEKLSNFGYYIENNFCCNSQTLRVSPEATFNCAEILGEHAPAPPTHPVIRVVLFPTEGPCKNL